MSNHAEESELFCPGERYSISREVHLGRLASFYSKCRTCVHRDNHHPLTSRTTGLLSAVHRRATKSAGFDREGWSGIAINEVDTAKVRHLAAAFAAVLQDEKRANHPLAIVVAGDSQPRYLEWLAAAHEGLRYAAAKVIDIGPATAACLALAVLRSEADGGLLVAGDSDRRQRVRLRFWGSAGFAWSAGGGLDKLRARTASRIDRPRRHYGPSERYAAQADYLDRLRPVVEHSNPLRVVLASSCGPSRRWLIQLAAKASIEVIDFRGQRPSAGRGESLPSGGRTPPQLVPSHVVPMIDALRAQLLAAGADVGAYIDEQGEVLHLLDERGRFVPPSMLVLALIASRGSHPIAARVVLENDTPRRLADAMQRVGTRTFYRDASRESMSRAVWRENTLYGSGPSGRIWFRQPHGAADALRGLLAATELVRQMQRPLSAVIDRALAMGGQGGYDHGPVDG